MNDPHVSVSNGGQVISIKDGGAELSFPAATPIVPFVAYVYGHRYRVGERVFLRANASLDEALRDIRELEANRHIHAQLVWREVTVDVGPWK